MPARFKRDIQSCAFGARPGDAQRLDFCMRAAEAAMPPFADDFAGLRDDTSHHRIRLDQPFAAASKLKRAGHVPEVGHNGE